jgi:hypothetical protein
VAAVAAGTLLFGGLNIANARALAPNWGMDLAFFHQLVHSAARGGPWASPLLLEPQGFLEMVHTHLVLPLVVAVYALVPRQEVLLLFQGLFGALALWPAFRLGEEARGRLGGVLAVVGLVAFGPVQAVATADFRPSVLLFPGVFGALVAARQRRLGPMLAWALVANLGRQEAPYLLGAAAAALCVLPWGGPDPGAGPGLLRGWWARLRLREGLVLGTAATLLLVGWLWLKPTMFFHFDPLHRATAASLPPDHLADRLTTLGRIARSGAGLGLLAPGALGGALPLVRELLETGREWGPLQGPGAHYHAFWLPFLAAAGIAGAGRLGWPGLVLFGVLNGLAFPWIRPRSGPVELRALIDQVGPEERVAADYDTIAALAGRAVLWNEAQLRMRPDERPRGWHAPWPIPPQSVDLILTRAQEPWVEQELAGWTVRARQGDHLLLAAPLGRPDERDTPKSPGPR